MLYDMKFVLDLVLVGRTMGLGIPSLENCFDDGLWLTM